VPELSLDFKYSEGNFDELYDLYRIVRDMVHGDGLNEEELPEKVRTLTKSKLIKLVSSVDSYARDVFDRITRCEKITPINPE
jgi:hypothetical protein